MSEVLGTDIDGRPIRAGDRAVIAIAGQDMDLRGVQFTVLGEGAVPDTIESDLPAHPESEAAGFPHLFIATVCLRILRDDDEASWDQVEKITGWIPRRIERDVPEVV